MFYVDASLYSTGFKLNNIRFAKSEPQGTLLAYDAAGNRRTATTLVNGTAVTES